MKEPEFQSIQKSYSEFLMLDALADGLCFILELACGLENLTERSAEVAVFSFSLEASDRLIQNSTGSSVEWSRFIISS